MIPLAFVVSAILLLVTSTLRAAGAALVRTSRADALHDAAEGNERAAAVADLLQLRARIQPALAPVLTGLLVLAVIPLTWAVSSLVSGWWLALVVLVMAVVLVIVTDLVPRTIGRSRSSSLAYRLAPLLAVSIRLGDAANDLVSDEDEQEADDATNDNDGELELISSIIEFGDTIVREVMMPRTDMVTLPASASTDEAVDLVLEAGRSRVPLTGENVDDIVGILYARDLLELYDQHSPPRPCLEIAHDPYFVPETKPIADLLREMQANQRHLAIVVDEFGGTAGLVTIEDLLEEIVGEIVDEYDTEEPMVIPLEEGGLLVDARLDVDDLASALGTEFPDADWDTVGGLILGLAGRVPKTGESFEYDDLLLTAEQVQGRRVAMVRVARR
ncbi:MAG: HlyC/CorC family transporter [Acidobacteria bacterium]|nr:HlyC/CorC family transporter [Acidobacteriota bacterium]